MPILMEKYEGPGSAKAGVLLECASVLFERVQGRPPGSLLRVRGEVGRAGRPTGNGRVYTEALFRREVKALAPHIAKRKVVGELDHPKDGRATYERTAFVITDLILEDDGRLIAEYEVLDTTFGRTLRALLEADVMVGASIRGYGTTSMREGVEVVNDDYRLLAFDVVVDPADSDAYPETIRESLTESLTPGRRNAADADVDLASKLEEAFREGRAVGASDTRAQLMRDFAEKLVEAVTAAREDERALVESEAGAIPGALAALQRVKEALVPFILPTDYKRAIASVQTEMRETSRELQEARQEAATLRGIAREASYRLHVQAKVPQALQESVWTSLSKLGELADLDEDTFAATVPEATTKAVVKVGNDLSLREAAAADAAVQAYILEVSALHPHRSAIRARAARERPRTKADVDAIVSSVTGSSGRPHLSLSQRVSNLAEGRGVGFVPPQEDQ